VNNLLKVITHTNDIEKKFDLLADSIQHCRLCPCLESRTKVFSECNGNINSNVLFIAEAPGRLGADRTAIPLFGDQTGNNFQCLIDTIGWSREEFFVTNAVLCNPRDDKGNNASPSKDYIKNCSIYLEILIRIMDPEYVITLGQKALDSLQLIKPVDVKLRENVRTLVSWNNRNLIPLYHTGPRALIHRSFYNQLADFYWVKQQIKLCAKPWKRIKDIGLATRLAFDKAVLTKLQKVILDILGKVGPITEFQLAKLLYLIDYNFIKVKGRLVTNSFYLRAYDGPLPMGMDRQLKELAANGFIRYRYGKIEIISSFKNGLQDEEKETVSAVVLKHGKKTKEQIKTITYLTKPMKRILRAEKEGLNMLWKPVLTDDDFKNS